MPWGQTSYPFAPGTGVLPGSEQTQTGTITGALVDGSTITVTYASGYAFPIATDAVVLVISALSNANDLLGKEIFSSITTTGFSFSVPGGNPGDTATITWTAYGH